MGRTGDGSARVTALGTGSAVGLPPRGNASLLLELGGTPILVDAPGDVPHRLMAAAVDPLDLAAMVLTHHHEDHWGGLPGLLLHRMVRRRFGVALRLGESAGDDGPPLPILAPPAAAAFLGRLLALTDRTALAAVEPFAEDDGRGARPVGEAGWTFEPIAGEHGEMPVSGFVVRRLAGGPVIAYSSDSEPTERFLTAAAGADLLVHECQQAAAAPPGHADAESLAAMIRRLETAGVAPPRRLATMHVAAWPEDEDERIRRTLDRELPSSVEVIVPEDGAVLLDVA